MSKLIVITIMIFSTGCSAAFVNRESTLSFDNVCENQKYALPIIDLGVSSALAASAVAGKMDKDVQQALLWSAAAGFAVSAIMGYGEVSQCEE